MSSQSVPIPASPGTNLDTSSMSSSSSSIWDRLSTWASENKAIVYTVAGVAVVTTGAGLAYYILDSRSDGKTNTAEEKRKASKKERRKAKKEKEKERDDSDKEAKSPKASEQGNEHQS